jgi:hypothetical protein
MSDPAVYADAGKTKSLQQEFNKIESEINTRQQQWEEAFSLMIESES